jgi:hypothetical protein
LGLQRGRLDWACMAMFVQLASAPCALVLFASFII